jgi:large subunit ribosomal protein L3
VQVGVLTAHVSKLTKGELGHLKKAGATAMRTLVEFRGVEVGGSAGGGEAGGESGEGEAAEAEEASSDLKVGDDVTVTSFEPGQRVKVSAVSIGKGFQGTIKRHNFSRGPETHGSHNVRAPGSVGASADPARVFKGMRMPGQMGARRVTQRGARVFDVDAERNLLLIRGSVPGGRTPRWRCAAMAEAASTSTKSAATKTGAGSSAAIKATTLGSRRSPTSPRRSSASLP